MNRADIQKALELRELVWQTMFEVSRRHAAVPGELGTLVADATIGCGFGMRTVRRWGFSFPVRYDEWQNAGHNMATIDRHMELNRGAAAIADFVSWDHTGAVLSEETVVSSTSSHWGYWSHWYGGLRLANGWSMATYGLGRGAAHHYAVALAGAVGELSRQGMHRPLLDRLHNDRSRYTDIYETVRRAAEAR